MTTPRFQLAWLTSFSAPPAVGRWAGDATGWADGSIHLSLARALERAAFDLVVVTDDGPLDVEGDGTGARQDPMPLVTLMGAGSSRLGVVGTTGVDSLAPYHVARSVATLDNLLGGRAGWNARLSEGPDAVERAVEFADVLRALWTSWEPDAVVLDRSTPVYADFRKVHPIDHDGVHFRSRGPLNALPPRSRPLITATQDTDQARAFAARRADVVVVPASDPAGMSQRRDELRAAAEAAGRNAEELSVLFAVRPVLADTAEEAQALALGAAALDSLDLVGTPLDVAKRLIEVCDEIGGDGFAIDGPIHRRYVAEITEGLVPALRLLRQKGRTRV